jgi:hypothetical protein
MKVARPTSYSGVWRSKKILEFFPEFFTYTGVSQWSCAASLSCRLLRGMGGRRWFMMDCAWAGVGAEPVARKRGEQRLNVTFRQGRLEFILRDARRLLPLSRRLLAVRAVI